MPKKKKINRKVASMTLIEIAIIIALLAIFIGLSIEVIKTQFVKVRDAERKLDIGKLRMSLESYYDTYGCYPSSLPECEEEFALGKDILILDTPCDPKTKEKYYYDVDDEGTCKKWYRLYGSLERTDDRIIQILGCLSGCGSECEYNYGVSSPNTSIESCALEYVCAPGGGKDGSCEVFEAPELSECPRVYLDNPTCNNDCSDPKKRCANSKGKHVPD